MKKEALLQSAATLAAAMLAKYPTQPTDEELEKELIAATKSVEKISAQLEWPNWLRSSWWRKN